MTKRAVLYARVSSDDRGKEGRNLESQLDMCREYANKHGWQIVADLPEDDRGASGASFELPQLNHLREMAEAGEFDVLVVREIDRLSRNLAKQLIVEEELRRAGVQIAYVLGEYPDTPEGNLMKNIKASIAEYERLKIAERATRGRRNIVKRGQLMLHGERPPYGYRLSGARPPGGGTPAASPGGDDKVKVLVVYEPEARIVRLIYTWYTQGDETGKRLSSRAIATRLTEMKVPTWADVHGARKKRGYGEWSWRQVIDILHDETYAGRWHYGRRNCFVGKVNPRDHWLSLEVPAIVSRDVWEKAQEQIKRNTTPGRGKAKYPYLLRRRVRCGLCGSGVCGYATTVSGKLYQYYRCNAYMGNVANTTCDLPSFRVDHVDAAVWEWVKSFLTDPQALREGLSAYQAEKERENEPLRGRLGVVEDLLKDNRTQLERLLDLYLGGEFPKERLLERKVRLETTIEGLERERGGLMAQLEAQTLTEEQMQTIEEFAAQVAGGLAAAEQDFETRQRIIDLLDVWVTLSVENGEKIVYAQCIVGKSVLPMMCVTSRRCCTTTPSSAGPTCTPTR